MIGKLIGRLLLGRSQTEMAAALGLQQPTVSQIIHGKRRVGRRTLARLVVAFPERREELISAFLAQNGNNHDDDTDAAPPDAAAQRG